MTSLDEPTEARDPAPSVERARAPVRTRARRRLGPPSYRARRFLGFLVLPVSLLCAGLLTTPSYAVFNRTTSNTTDNWTAGTVSLQNNSSGTNAATGSALFTATGLQPGANAAKCVAVTSYSTVGSAVSLYVSNVTPSAAGTLPSYVSISVELGSGSSGTNGDCSGYVPESPLLTNVRLSSMPTTFGGGATGWTPSATATKVFKITYTVDMTVPNTLQSSTASATFVWEAQSS